MKTNTVFHRKNEKGQSFVELGLSLVFLLVLLAAVVDLGWAFFTVIALRDAAQEAATVGSICPTPADEDKVINRLKASASAPIDLAKLENSQIDVCIVSSGSNTCDLVQTPALGKSVQVSITYEHDIVTPLVGGFIGTQKYPIKVTSADTILRLDCDAITE